MHGIEIDRSQMILEKEEGKEQKVRQLQAQQTKNGYPQLNKELKSLGIDPKRKNELNNKEELETLVDNVKQSMYQDYKTAYSDKGSKHEEEAKATVNV